MKPSKVKAKYSRRSGAGPSGLCLALLLRQSSISSTIYERDSDATSRGTQGGSLDLHWDTGLLALRKAGLWTKFLQYARYDSQAMVIADKHDARFFDENEPSLGVPGAPAEGAPLQDGAKESQASPPEDDEMQRPEIDRIELRQLLLEVLPENAIRWGQKVQSVSEGSNNTINLNLEDNTSETYDLVIGADGVWSRVRPFLTDTKPVYTGVGGFDLKITRGADFPHVNKFVGSGAYMSCSDRKTILAQQNGSGAIVIYAWRAREEGWEKNVTYDTRNPVAIKEALREEYQGWNENIVQLTQVADGDILVRSLYMLPVGHRWGHRKGATLIGDAAHAMTPFAGEGVNTALADSLELAERIITAVQQSKWQAGALDEAVKMYEDTMFVRAEPVCQESWNNLQDFIFDSQAPKTFVERVFQGPPS